MASYHVFTTTRATPPDLVALQAALRTALGAPELGVALFNPALGEYRAKKSSPFTAQQIADIQAALDTAPTATDRTEAQRALDAMTLYDRAIVLTMLDQFNFLRARLPTPLPAITVPQLLTAIRDKAGTL